VSVALTLAQAKVQGPAIDWAGLSPLLALFAGATIVLLIGLLRARAAREVLVPVLALASFGTAIGCGIWQLGERSNLISGAMRLDELTIVLTFIFCAAGMATVLLSWRSVAVREASHGEFYALLLTSAAGMFVFVAAQNLVALFLGLELLSIPLYVLCATEMRRSTSLESGLKYLIIGSVGSATLLYGLAFIYGATGQTGFEAIAHAMKADAQLRKNLLSRVRMFFYAGAGALRRAQLAKRILEERFKIVKLQAEEVRIDFLGVNAIHGAMSPADQAEPYEVAVRVAARCRTREEAIKVGREVDGMAVSGVAMTGKRVPHQDRTREIIGVWSSLVAREKIEPKVSFYES